MSQKIIKTCTQITKFKDFSNLVNDNIKKFTTNNKVIASVAFSYVEAMTLFELLNLKPKFIKVIGEGAFNIVIEISLEIPKNSSTLEQFYFNTSKLNEVNNSRFALRLSKNENSIVMNSLSKDFTYYTNYNLYNSMCLNTYYTLKPKNYIFDSYNFDHFSDKNENSEVLNIITHYTLSPIYEKITDDNYKNYRLKYIQTLQNEIKYFNEANELRYFDWKIDNFMIDTKNDKLILTDTDILSVTTINNELCSSHRLYPDPTIDTKVFDIGYSIEKKLRSYLYMYVSYYLSINAVCKCKTLDEYYESLQYIDKFDKRIDRHQTIKSVIEITSNALEPIYTKSYASSYKKEIYRIIDNIKRAADELINNFKE